MNPILDGLPEHVVIDGIKIPINSDFRIWIRLDSILNAGEDVDPFYILSLCYPSLPNNPEQALSQMIWFASLGSELKEKSAPALPKSSGGRGYSFDEDYGYIYAAFMQTYRIDLFTVSLHWWAFKSLLDALPDSTLFKKIVQIRTIEISSKMPKAEQKYYQEMKKLYALKSSGKNSKLSYEEYKQQMIDYVKRRTEEVRSDID